MKHPLEHRTKKAYSDMLNEKSPIDSTGKFLIEILVLLILGLILSAPLFSQHLDVGIGGSSRLHGKATLGIAYRNFKGIEFAAFADAENKHNLSTGATIGYKATNKDEPEEGWVFSGGASYQWYTELAKSELKNGFMPVGSARFYGGWGYWEFRYSANAFNIGLGYRFFSHKKLMEWTR